MAGNHASGAHLAIGMQATANITRSFKFHLIIFFFSFFFVIFWTRHGFELGCWIRIYVYVWETLLIEIELL